MTFLFSIILIVYGGCQGLLGCEVQVHVRRGTQLRVPPDQSVQVKCPVTHCGRTVKVVWCKVLDSNECKNLTNSDHIRINESMLLDAELESVLMFTNISAEDSGIYSCRELHHGSIGHLITVLVSESKQENQTDDTNPELKNGQNDGSESDAATMGNTSLAYFVTFLCAVLILFTFVAVVMLRTYRCKCKPRHQPNSQDVQPSPIIPALPKRNPPVLYPSLPLENDISSASLEPSPNDIRDVRDQGLQETSEHQCSALYSKIDRTKSQKQVAISVVSSELI